MQSQPRTVTSGSRARAALSTFSVALMSLVAAFVLAGCLGPDEVDPTGNAPFGRIDSAVAAGTSIRIRGWAIDPNTSAPVQVSVSHLSIGSKHLANVSRPDVALVHPKYGANHGFDITTPSGGKNGDLGQVCLWVENVGAGKDDRILGCRDVRLRSDDATGRFETAKALNSRAIRIAGWALDPETANPVNIRYSVDGNPAVTALARNPRADVNRALNVEGHHGFSIDLSVAVGSHRVCISVIGVGRGKNADLGCKTVVTESVTPVVAGADLKSVSPVGPLPSHPLAGIDRDAGVSTILSDGSVLWLFGDSSGWNENGTIKYFINNTAAWAPKSNPTVTTDGVAPGSEPFQFVFPSKPFTQPCRAGWKSAMWPMSAVTVPKSASEDRVVAFMGNVCMGPGAWQMESRGVSVVEWIYTSTPSPSGNKIAGRVLQQNLF
ncbi:MAG TPA: hypothetical protein VL068_07755, partial [Microthrixaceae bacterium]|nr:hypothetical protein [Microthrixaceae bacterium]